MNEEEVLHPVVIEDYRDMPAGPARNAAKTEAFKNQYAIAGERTNTVVQGSSELTPTTIGAAIESMRTARVPTREEQMARDVFFGGAFGRGFVSCEAQHGRLDGAMRGILCRRGHQQGVPRA